MSLVFIDPRSIINLSGEVQFFPQSTPEPCATCGETCWITYEPIRNGDKVIAWKATCKECSSRAEILNL